MSTPNSPRRGTRPAEDMAQETPYAHLRQLAGAIRKPSTPLRATQNGESTSARRGFDRTPASGARTPALNRPSRPVPAKKGAPTTPHAIRALQQRRAATAASTPGRDRRRSGRQERETPRDILRQLSKVEAPRTRPTVLSPNIVQKPGTGIIGSDEADSDTDFARPYLTLPIEDDDEDDSFQAPPQISGAFEEETQTQVSIEGPRRDFAELGRVGRDGVRASDRFIDLEDMEFEDFTQGLVPNTGSPGDNGFEFAEANLQGADTEDLRGILADRSGLLNDTFLQNQPIEDADSTFAFEIPTNLGDELPILEEDFGKEVEQAFPVDEQVAPHPVLSRPSPAKRQKKALRKSRYGISYPSLPTGVVKKITTSLLRSSGNSKTKVNSDILSAILQSSDWFFEQLGEDLGVYAEHASKKTVDETDIITLMKRQRLLNAASTPFSLAQKHLPAELLQGIRMTRPKVAPKGRKGKRPLQSIPEERGGDDEWDEEDG